MLEDIKKTIYDIFNKYKEKWNFQFQNKIYNELQKELDKYKEQEIDKSKFINEFLEANPWKKAWEELKTLAPQYFLCSRMEELEQKHNISKEME